MAKKLIYRGGIPEIKKPGAVTVKVAAESVMVSAGMFKELPDSGAITQDEYDAKKKQLLGL